MFSCFTEKSSFKMNLLVRQACLVISALDSHAEVGGADAAAALNLVGAAVFRDTRSKAATAEPTEAAAAAAAAAKYR
jgi:hypothetical protein